MKLTAWFAVLLMMIVPAVHAAGRANVVVEGVQMPAWAEHASGARDPLAIGMALSDNDRVYTGPGARALLRLADGSLIKLGENGIVTLSDLGQKKILMKDVVTATLGVVKGAFRFTTQALYRYRGQRDVSVRVGTITAGIRGTDLWGKAESSRDIMCLLEGRIEISRGREALTMDQPLTFFIAPENQPSLPVAPAPQEQLAVWVQETEIGTDTGAIRKGGRWRVYLADAQNQDDALATYDRLRAAGYAAEIRPAKAQDATIYRVRISNFATRRDAEIIAATLKGKMGIAEPKVSR